MRNKRKIEMKKVISPCTVVNAIGRVIMGRASGNFFVIRDGTTSIDAYAFVSRKLTNVTIPNRGGA